VLEIQEIALVRAYLGLVEHAGAAILGAVGVEHFAQHAGPRQAYREVVIAHGSKVERADYVRAARHAHESYAAALVVVNVEPSEAVPGVVYAPERGCGLVDAAQVAHIAAHGVVY